MVDGFDITMIGCDLLDAVSVTGEDLRDLALLFGWPRFLLGQRLGWLALLWVWVVRGAVRVELVELREIDGT